MTEVIRTKILKNEKVSAGVFQISLELPLPYPESVPGQFVNLYLNNQAKILPRPISIFDHENHELDLVYMVTGDGTGELSAYKGGDEIRVSTPLGNGYTIPTIGNSENIDSILLVGGGMGIAPLHYLAKTMRLKYRESNQKPLVHAVLGYKDMPFLHELFSGYCCEIRVSTETPQEGFLRGNVLNAIEEYEYSSIKNWFTCGPLPMQKALAEYAQRANIHNIQVSLEERMGCGFGTCVGCTVNIRESGPERPKPQFPPSADGCTKTSFSPPTVRKKVCKDGPVFMGSEVVWK